MDICSHDAVDGPIVLEDDGLDTELDSATSGDDDRNLEATPPPDANDHHISVPAVPAKPVASGQAEGSAAADSASGGQSLSNRSAKPKGVNNSSQQSVQDDEYGLQDLNRTITASPAKAGGDGISAGCLMERDGGGPRPELENQRLEPTGSAPTAPNLSSWKRSGPLTGSHAPPQKAVLSLLTDGGAGGEGDEGGEEDEGDVNMLGFSQRGKATARIPTS